MSDIPAISELRFHLDDYVDADHFDLFQEFSGVTL